MLAAFLPPPFTEREWYAAAALLTARAPLVDEGDAADPYVNAALVGAALLLIGLSCVPPRRRA